MAIITNYTELQAEIGNWLNRSDLASAIPGFVQLAEATIKRRLRRSSVRKQVSLTQQEFSLAADVAELRSLRLVSSDPWCDGPIKIVTPEIFYERLAGRGGVAGRPTHATVISGAPGAAKLLVSPAPDQSYTLELIYFQQIVPLSSDNLTNALLTEAPDAYLWGALLQAEPFLEHDERIPTWQAKFDAAIEELNEAREREEYGAGLRPARFRQF